MDCWICGSPATTGEHLIKASDLRALFGPSNSKNPLRKHDKDAVNQIVQSENSRRLMSDARLCAKCNNTVTQPYDRAWETLSKYLRSNWKEVLRSRCFRFDKVFRGDQVQNSAVSVHLYFVKLFGCRVAEENPQDVELSRFALALKHKLPHPNIYLQFGNAVSHRLLPTASISPIHALINESNGRLQVAMWYYTIGDLTVRIGYFEPGPDLTLWRWAWHPDSTNYRVQLRRYVEPVPTVATAGRVKPPNTVELAANPGSAEENEDRRGGGDSLGGSNRSTIGRESDVS